MSSKKNGFGFKKILTQKKTFKKAIMPNDWSRKAPKSPSQQVGVYAILIFFTMYRLALKKQWGFKISAQS